MFEHRLRIFLLVLLCVISTLLMRAFHLQVITKSEWQRDAEDFNKRAIYTETTRGRIIDHNGTELAVDQGCMDACVDYRAISRNKKWIDSVAAQRVSDRIGEEQYRRTAKAQRNKLIEEEAVNVNRYIDRMWAMLAEVDQKTPGEIEEICNTINLKVAMRSRYVQYKRYQIADEEHEKSGPPPWYRRWLIEGGDGGPSVDDFAEDSGEESDVHPIVKNITNEVYLRLAREQSRMPGLVLRAGTIRKYHFGKAGAHVLGILTSVTRKDMEEALDLEDELRKYELTDLIGRGGLEGMCESALRGTRGKMLRQAGRNDEQVSPPVPGHDVKTTIDIGLQAELQQMFEHMEVPLVWGQDTPTTPVAMHGAAVVIDVKSGAVRALASYPDYDVNDLQRNYEAIAGRDDEAPLMNRATQSQLEPGSTIKPVVGLSAISDPSVIIPGIGHPTARTGIQCTGYLILNGRRLQNGRCWTATKYAKQLGDAAVSHHPFPHPHHGSYGNPDGYLVFADALERSCNVFFETCGDAMGIAGLSKGFDKFGLGRETGIGIAEARGYLPNRISSPLPSHAWFSGIGQSGVLATPIQMANVAATIARDGTWMRPRLIENSSELNLPPAKDRFGNVIPDQVNLGLDAEALAACRDGMIRVVNSENGTGKGALMNGIVVAGKTGTAEAKERFYSLDDAQHPPIIDPKGRKTPIPWERSIGTKVGKYSWYRGAGDTGSQLNHAWFIGFAPANDPQVAFSIMIEYGGSGNFAARHAPKIVEKCI
jgi:penicillin-binding protein 2